MKTWCDICEFDAKAYIKCDNFFCFEFGDFCCEIHHECKSEPENSVNT